MSESELDGVETEITDDEATLTMVEDIADSSQHADQPAQCYSPAPTPAVNDEADNVIVPAPSVPQSSDHHASGEPAQCSEQRPSPAVPQTTEQPSREMGHKRLESAPEEPTVAGSHQVVMESFQKAFDELTSVTDLQDLVELHNRIRVVVSVEKLMELKGTQCSEVVSGTVCGAAMQYSAKHIGARVDLEWKCGKNHCGKWESSEVLTKNRFSKVFLNDSLLPIAIVLSGNNYSKFQLPCKVLNLSLVSKSNFCSFQAKCALPVVKDVWSKMRCLVLEILRGYKEICVCGDGRNDSPGHSARYCVYTLMEHATKVVVDLEVIDKRETGGNSAVMEREGLR